MRLLPKYSKTGSCIVKDPLFETVLESWVMMESLFRKSLAIDHSREMLCEIHERLDKIEDMLSYLLLEGQNR
jgi:hypothetical protein